MADSLAVGSRRAGLMPELPEVESLRLSLKEHLLGNRVVGTEVRLGRIVRAGNLSTLEGRVCSGIQRIGKWLHIGFEADLTLCAHMGMSGTLLWRTGNYDDLSHIRAVLRFAAGVMLFRDPRTLGGLWIIGSDSMLCRPRGLDPLTAEFTSARLGELLQPRRSGIKQTLLNQAVLAGVGNIYASEALWTARINPAKRSCDLNSTELDRLRAAIYERLSAAVEARGTTFKDFRLSDGRSGGFAEFLNVYGRAGKPCRRCGNTVERIVQQGRSTFYCPRCQR